MPVLPRRGAKKPAVYEDSESEEEKDYDEEDDEDFDEEDYDEDLDDDLEDEDDDDNGISGILEGHLTFDEEEQMLHYQGDSFHFSASMKSSDENDKKKKDNNNGNLLLWNPLCDPPPPSNIATFQMKGTLQTPGSESKAGGGNGHEAPQKLPLRIFDVTWTIQRDGAPLSAGGKSTGDDGEEEDGKQKASPKRPALFYNVVGREVNSTEANIAVEFEGGFYPPAKSKATTSVPLNCQFKYVLSESNGAAAAAAAAAKPIAAAAAAAAAARNDEDYDDDDDIDEHVDVVSACDAIVLCICFEHVVVARCLILPFLLCRMNLWLYTRNKERIFQN